MPDAERPQRRRTGLFLLAWLTTAALAIAISGWAVGLASRQVTDPIASAALGELGRSVATAPSPVPGPSAAATRPPHTVSSVGGRAAFRFEGEQATLDWATPATGFEVDVEEEHGELRVRFRAGHHESRIFASIRAGEPVTRVAERPDDD